MAKKRGHGEGSIYKDDRGLWRAVISLGVVDGKQKRKYLSGKTRREVAEKLGRALQDQRQGTLVTDERQTVAQFMASWLASRKGKIRVSTLEVYEYVTRIHIAPRIGHLRLAALTAQHVQRFVDDLSTGTELSPKTIRHVHGTLRAALNRALALGIIRVNPAASKLIELPKARRYLVTPWTSEQVGRFLTAAQGDRFEAAFYLALGAGLREGEVLGLTWSRTDLDAARALVSQKVERVRGEGLKLSRPKGDAGEATVTLPAIVVQKLREHRPVQARERLMAGGKWPTADVLCDRMVDEAERDQYRADFVFTSRVGTAVDPAKLYRNFQKIRQAADLPAHRFHDLRHDHASFLLSLGASPKEIQASLRHSQIGLTMDTYTHLLDVVSRENASKMDGMIRDAIGGSS